MACAIPIVDVSPFLVQIGGSDKNDAVLATAQEWDNAMKEFGCAVIVGHGISESTFDRVNAECRDFFSKSLKEKLVYNHGIYGNPNGGYTSPGNEIVASSMDGASVADEPKKFDPVENFVFTSHPSEYVSPAGLPSPFLSATQYYECMENVLAVIHRMSCVALGIENVDYFRQFYDKTLPGNERLGINGNALRLAHYPPINPEALHGKENMLIFVPISSHPLSRCMQQTTHLRVTSTTRCGMGHTRTTRASPSYALTRRTGTS